MRVFTENQTEYKFIQMLIEKFKQELITQKINVMVNEPRDSYAITVWSIDDVLWVLQDHGIDCSNITDEVIENCMVNMSLIKILHEVTVTEGNELIREHLSDIINYLAINAGIYRCSCSNLFVGNGVCSQCGLSTDRPEMEKGSISNGQFIACTFKTNNK